MKNVTSDALASAATPVQFLYVCYKSLVLKSLGFYHIVHLQFYSHIWNQTPYSGTIYYSIRKNVSWYPAETTNL